jgi:hypothetical protein
MKRSFIVTEDPPKAKATPVYLPFHHTHSWLIFTDMMAQHAISPSRSSFRPPYTHYATIYLDHEEKVKTKESRSIQEQRDRVFTPEVFLTFLGIISEINQPSHGR